MLFAQTRRRCVAWLLAALILLVSGGGVLAQGTLPAAGGFPLSPGEPTHGWGVLLVGESDVSAVLLHVPPRTLGAGESQHSVSDGAVRPASYLSSVPDWLAARGNEVLLVFPPATDGRGNRVRRVAALTAVAAPIGGLWVSYPEGRFLAMPPLPGEGTLLGAAGTADGYVALIDGVETGGPTLHRLDGDGWEEIPGPSGEGPPISGEARPRLLALPDGVGVLLGGVEPGLWAGRAASEDAAERTEWTWTPLELGERFAAETSVVHVRGRLIMASRSGGGTVELWDIGEDAPLRLARLDGIPRDYALVPLEDAGRVAVLWTEISTENPPAQPRTQGSAPAPEAVKRRHHIAEVSVLTGRILYRGATKPESPVSPRDFQLLAVLLAGVMLVIVLFVLKPESGREEFGLPQGYALAEPGRRVVAGLIDAAPALILAIRLNGADPADLLSISGLLGEGNGLLTLLTTVALGFLHSTLGEWLLGRSIGKALAGCEVVAVRQERGPEGMLVPVISRPRLWQAVVRNLVRWAVPPLALEGLSNPARRHRGDTLAGTAVVIRIEQEPSGASEG